VAYAEAVLRVLFICADVLVVPLFLLQHRWPLLGYLLSAVIPLCAMQAVLYCCVFLLASSERLQTYQTFGHIWYVFGPCNFDRPSRSGLPHARNVGIRTSDGEILGGWHVLPGGAPARAAARRVAGGADVDEVYDAALSEGLGDGLSEGGCSSRPAPRAVIYLHGMGESRAKWIVVEHLKLISTLLGMHVLAIDYRGFADSTGAPTELGFITDAAACLTWLMERGLREDEVVVWGHSLGTGVSVRLAHAQQQRGAPLHAVVLESAYTSMRLASSQYPVVLPFRALPFGRSIVWRYFRKSADEARPALNRRLATTAGAHSARHVSALAPLPQLDTQARITDLGCPVLLLHGAADIMVPMEPHSKALAIGLKEAAKSHVFVPLPDAGHLDVVLHPTLLATLVDFFEGSSARDGGKGALEP
jgi:pimeloyl-ACP methyl ester carboxylesterase